MEMHYMGSIEPTIDLSTSILTVESFEGKAHQRS
jgi:hypothetical protein